MSADVISAIIQAGGAVSVAIAFIWYLDRRDKAQGRKDSELQRFFQQMHEEDNKSVIRLADVIDTLVKNVQALTVKFDSHDEYERQVFQNMDKPAPRQRTK